MTAPISQLPFPAHSCHDEDARPPTRGAGVELERVSRSFGSIAALRDVSLRVASRELLAVTGCSGSGKSTLLNLIAVLDQPSAGRVLIVGEPIWEGSHIIRARRELVGFVFQQHLLLNELSAQANVEVPLVGADVARRERHHRALELLEQVGLPDRAEHLPSMLSGGERQRVAVARALKLRVPGGPDLARQDHVKRRSERARNLGSHGHAAAWDTHDDGVLTAKLAKQRRQAAFGIVTICEARFAVHPRRVAYRIDHTSAA
jgi:putative ABC transport system ATP-binding protein